jgi:hypothetical protein
MESEGDSVTATKLYQKVPGHHQPKKGRKIEKRLIEIID